MIGSDQSKKRAKEFRNRSLGLAIFLLGCFIVTPVAQGSVMNTQLSARDEFFVLDNAELTKQWYLPKIQMHRAWDVTLGSDIIVAVLDTGINAKHEDLNDGRVIAGFASYCQATKATNSDECLVHVSGDLAAGVNSDDNGHGTIVAGIIGGISNNGKGIAGIVWNVKLMPIKAVNSGGIAFPADVAAGIRWAADHGAKVINISIGGPIQGGQVLIDAVTHAFNKGVLIVAAAGNDSSVIGDNLNASPIMPVCADGGQNMVVGVAAVDANDKKATFSNYGSNCIDLSAPGTGGFDAKQKRLGLISTYYDPLKPGELNRYASVSGTSVATPIVSGIAALMISAFPDLDVRAVRNRLFASVDNIDALNAEGCQGSCVGQLGTGRINAYKAVTSSASSVGGSIVKNASGKLFLIERGLRRPISQFVFDQRFAGSSADVISEEQINAYPSGNPVTPADGSIIKDSSSALVYLVEGGERRGLSYLSFISRGLRFENVISLPVDEVQSYPLGANASVFSGALVKAANHPAVFIINNSKRQLLSYFVFKQRGFDRQPIGIISDEELASYPQDVGLYSPLDGTLFRGEADATVYLFEGGKRQGLSFDAFQNRGFKFADVKTIPQSEIDIYDRGEDLIN